MCFVSFRWITNITWFLLDNGTTYLYPSRGANVRRLPVWIRKCVVGQTRSRLSYHCEVNNMRNFNRCHPPSNSLLDVLMLATWNAPSLLPPPSSSKAGQRTAQRTRDSEYCDSVQDLGEDMGTGQGTGQGRAVERTGEQDRGQDKGQDMGQERGDTTRDKTRPR